MKKWIAICLALLMLLPLTACGKRAEKQKLAAWEAQYNLGIRYLSEGNYEEARLAFESAIEIEPKKGEAYIGIAEAYIALGQPEKAQAILEAGLAQAEEPINIQLLLDEIIATYLSFDPEDFDVSGTCGEDAYWGFHEDTGELVIWGSGKMDEYKCDIIPGKGLTPWYELDIQTATVRGVTTIGDWAFGGFENLSNVSIGGNVTTIGECAFSSCKNLTEINIPDSVITIEGSAFCWCDGLTEIYIPSSVTTIKDFVFGGCSNLKTVTLTNGVTSIGDEAFYNCISLIEITIPDSVISIGDLTFLGCRSLIKVDMGSGVTSIGNRVFYDCVSLTGFSANSPGYCDVDGVLFTKDMKTLVWYPSAKEQTFYAIPDGVTTIGYEAFSNNSNLIEIVIPDSVTSIENSAFFICSNLRKVTLPNSVTSIGDSAFSECGHLTTVTIPNSVTSIGEGAFRQCSSLTDIYIDNAAYCSVDGVLFTKDMKTLLQYPNGKQQASYNIPAGVSEIADNAFWCCSNLKEITIPNSITTIGNSAFMGCLNLEAVSMGYGVSVIKYAAFYGCSNITTMLYSGTKAQWDAIEIGVENECLTASSIQYTD